MSYDLLRVTQRDERGKFMNAFCRRVLAVSALCMLILSVAAPRGYAQDQDSHSQSEVASLDRDGQPAANTSTASAKAASDEAPVQLADRTGRPVSAEVLDELNTLKQRLALLETELKSRPASSAAEASQQELNALKEEVDKLEAELKADPATAAQGQSASAAAAPSASAAPAAAPALPQGLQEPPATQAPDNFTPFAWADWSWLNGTGRGTPAFDTSFFTPEIRFDTNFIDSLNHPKDHTLGGSTESYRTGEVQIEQASFGGDFHWNNVRGRILTMFGEFATTTPRNDASAGVGQWD